MLLSYWMQSYCSCYLCLPLSCLMSCWFMLFCLMIAKLLQLLSLLAATLPPRLLLCHSPIAACCPLLLLLPTWGVPSHLYPNLLNPLSHSPTTESWRSHGRYCILFLPFRSAPDIHTMSMCMVLVSYHAMWARQTHEYKCERGLFCLLLCLLVNAWPTEDTRWVEVSTSGSCISRMFGVLTR